MMKKLLAMGLVFSMTVAMFTGCQSKDDGKSNSDKQTEGETTQKDDESNAESDAANEDVYEMVMEVITYGFDDPDAKLVEDAVNEITVPEIGVKVKFLSVPIPEMGTKLGLLVTGGEKIDLVNAGLLTTPSNLVTDGLLMDISEYVENSEVLSTLGDGLLEACKVGGKIYAYPANVYPGTGARYFYDTALAEEYKIEMPESIRSQEDWELIFEQVKASGMDQYAISLGDGVAQETCWGNVFDTLGDGTYCSYGVAMDIENGTTVENWYATEEYVQQSKEHRAWYEKGYVVPDSISNGYTTMDTMTQGAIFGFVSPSGTGQSEAYFSSITGKTLSSIPVSDVTIKASDVVNLCWGVSSSSERPEKVVEFLELIYSNLDLANLLNYGIEGKHYVTQEGSKIIGYPEGLDSMSVGYGAFVGSYGENSQIYQKQPLTDDFVASIPEYGYGKAKTSKFLGYSFDTSKVSTAITAVNAVIGQYGPSISCGIVDPDKMIPEFLEALEAAGINEVIAENQAQLDAWLAAQ